MNSLRPLARLGVGLGVAFSLLLGGCEALEPPLVVLKAPPLSEEALAQEPLDMPAVPGLTEGTLELGQTLSEVLDAQALPEGTVGKLLHALGQKLDLRKLRPGVQWQLLRTSEGALERFTLTLSREKRYEVHLEDQQLVAREGTVQLEKRPLLVTGHVKTTIIDALLEQGQSIQFAMALVEAFQWDINFYTDVQPGDRFEALVEQVYVDGTPERVEHVLIARYEGATVGTKEAFRFGDEYFDARGQYLQRSFLTTPLSVLRITSRFGQRFHPILKIRRAHKGIDYGAGTGTPVWSVAEGQVLVAGNLGDGYGRQVMIQHAGGIVSRYAHLSRVSLRPGQRVKQKARVGAVGATGLASGPHLHFELIQNGVHINPARMKMLPTVVRKVKDMPAFEAERTRLLALLENHRPAAPVAAGPLPTVAPMASVVDEQALDERSE